MYASSYAIIYDQGYFLIETKVYARSFWP